MTEPIESMIQNIIAEKHPDIAKFIADEDARQKNNVELIASENFPSEAVKAACASSFIAKYAEGYAPERIDGVGNTGRYYGGCHNIDALEEYCCQKWREVFKTDYHVNVQPASGSHANMAAYQAILELGDKILSMDMACGHLTHSSPASFVSKLYEVHTYGLNENGFIDMDEVERLAKEIKPKLILAGASAYSRIIDFKRFKEIADEVGAYFMVDMAHIAGLVASGDHPSPFGLADIVTTTSQKTLRGPRGAMIFCKPELAKKVDSAIFPGTAGGPAENIIAAKAISAEECLDPSFNEYIHQVVKNSQAMANEFTSMGYEVVSGGTDNHLLVLTFVNTHPWLSGLKVQNELDKYQITLNKNRVPGDTRGPKYCSGVRIGTPAMTTKGWKEENFISCARLIDSIIKKLEEENKK